MIRLLFLPVFVFMISSCENTSNNAEMVYQISAADSVRCMEEILEGIIDDARRKQDFVDSIMRLVYVPHCCGIGHDVLRIELNSKGQLITNQEMDSSDLVERTYHYFMFNRNLTLHETNQFVMDSNYEGFDKPFYNRFSLDEIERRIEEELARVNEIKAIEGADPALVEYHFSKVEEWKERKKALDIIGKEELAELSPQAMLRFEYPNETKKSRAVLREIAYAFYQMRNYESLRYFDETYVSLYERAQRLGRKQDIEELDVLKLLHPARIVCEDRSKPSMYFTEIESPILQSSDFE